VGVCLSLALALGFPLLAWWRVRRPGALQELWLYSRPGMVVTGLLTAAVVVVVWGALIGLAAVAYPFLWSTVAMTAGGELALLIVLIQYLRHRPCAIDPPVDDSATSPPPSAPEAPSQSSSVHPRVHRDGDEA
jgi:hypothetical protein